jgi:hypothetical protein
MGFMDNMLEKSERRVLLAVIDGLESINDTVDYGIEQITCSENPRFKHLAVRVDLPTEAGFFHRCRNDWYASTRTDGSEYIHLHAVDKFNRNLAIAQLAMMIQAVIDGD